MLLLCLLAASALRPAQLRCEYRVEPLGIDVPAPRLSWIVESRFRNAVQTAYEIRVASAPVGLQAHSALIWDSGKVSGAETAGIAYGGRPLRAGERVYWNVTVWDGGDRPAMSRPSWWEAGLGPDGWHASWIGDSNAQTPYLRREFLVHGPVRRARLYATARGLYRIELDGKRLGPALLAPGWTDFAKRIQVQTFDVTADLQAGKNALGVNLGPGWYCGHVGWNGFKLYGAYPQALVQLEIEYADGTTDEVVSDGAWRVGAGPVREADLLMGETDDHRDALAGWSEPGFDDAKWTPASVQPRGPELLEGQVGPPVVQLAELPAQARTEPKPGVYVYDLRQNMVGWARLRLEGARGERVQVRYAEMLNKDGTLYTANLRGAKATDVYDLAGTGVETCEPEFTFHGFRYVEISGASKPPALADVTGVVVGSDCPPTGSFECSNALVNQLQSNIVWGQRSNYLDVPTDCPQRDERLGWMGDAETFAPTAAYNADIDAFMTKWTQDVVDGQTPQGAFRDVSPSVVDLAEGAPAWGDAGVIVPWDVYLAYDDKGLIAARLPAMKAWVDYIDRHNPNHLWIANRGNDFGDWLNVHDETPHEVISTAFFAHSAELVAKAAAAVNDPEAAKYAALASAVKRAFAATYVRADGTIDGDTQTDYILAIRFRLDPAQQDEFGDRLASLIAKRKDHLSSGFVGVGRLEEALQDAGRGDLAYRLLLNTDYPSWLYPVTLGATTVWERWDGYTVDKGFEDPGMNSFNHYAMGSVGAWLYSGVGGIAPDPAAPGYAKFSIAPCIEKGLTWAKTSLDSLRGPIASDWALDGSALTLVVAVPANTAATIGVPRDQGAAVRLDGKAVEPDRVSGGPKNEVAWFHVGGGTYRFETALTR